MQKGAEMFVAEFVVFVWEFFLIFNYALQHLLCDLG